uniref:Uncharacterized protein n=1 Tax=Rhizophora mucronata TaxID=61149 RepID=A0A2P2NFQ1_RHIMU
MFKFSLFLMIVLYRLKSPTVHMQCCYAIGVNVILLHLLVFLWAGMVSWVWMQPSMPRWLQ